MVNIKRTAVSHHNRLCIFTTFVPTPEANFPVDSAVFNSGMSTVHPTWSGSTAAAGSYTCGRHLCSRCSFETIPHCVEVSHTRTVVERQRMLLFYQRFAMSHSGDILIKKIFCLLRKILFVLPPLGQRNKLPD